MLREIGDRTKPYLVTLGIVAIALLLTLLLKPLLGTTNLPLFYAAVAISVWYGGMAAGLLATVLSTLAIQYFFLPPLHHLAVDDFAHVVRLSVFVLVTLIISSLNSELRAAKRRSQKSLLNFQASEEQYRLIVDTAYEGIWKYNYEAKTEFVNQRLAEMLGYTSEEMIGRLVFDFMDQDRRVQAEKILQRRKQGIKEQYDFCFRCKDGSELWAIVTSSPIIDQNGESIGGIAMLTDVTERKQAELALKESETRFRSIVESNMIGIAFWESDGSIKDPNAAFLNIIGYTEAEFNHQKIGWQQLTPSEYLSFDEIALKEIQEHKFCTPFEKEYFRKDGSRVPILIGGGSFKGCTDKGAFFVLDISKRQLAETALRQSENRFRTLVEQSPLSIQIIAPDGRTLQVNRAWEQLWGVGLDQILDYNMLEDQQLVEKGIMPYIKQAFAGEAVIIPPVKYDPNESIPDRTINQNPIRWVSAVAYPVKNEDGSIREIVLIHEDMTARQRAEETLKQREAELSLITNTVPVLIAYVDAEQRYRFNNQKYEEWFGKSPTEIYGKHIREAIGVAAYERIIPYIETVLSGQQVSFENEIYYPKIGNRYVNVTYVPQFGDNKEVKGFVALISDLTERKQAQAELEATNQTLQALIKACPLAIMVFDFNGIVKLWNPAAETIFGWSEQEAIGQFIPPVAEDKRQEFIANLDAIKQGQQFIGLEARRQTKSGVIIDVALWAALLQDSQGNLNCMSIIADITQRKQLEAERTKLLELEQSARIVAVNEAARSATAQQRLAFLAEASRVLSSSLDYKTILSTIADLVVPGIADFCFFDAVTPENKIERVVWRHADSNKKEWFDQVQYYVPTQDIHFHPVTSVLLTGKAQFIPEVSDNLLQKIAINSEHLQFLRGLNARSLITVPIIAHDRILGTLTFCVIAQSHRSYTNDDLLLAYDLAHRAALALDNANLYSEAQQANRMKDEFLATLSHELRTPLNSMLGWTQLLRTRTFDPKTSARALETIDRNTKSLAQLIEDVLDVSRIITGKLQLKTHPIELMPVIEAAIETVQAAANAKDIKIECLLNSTGKVLGDPNRLQQVVWNLLSNAVKFTPEGGRVEVRLEKINHHVHIKVIDTGKGINSEFLPYVFERFRQADNSITRSYGGLGLGLAIVRHLVELHGGTVHAESEGEGKGATFVVILPAIAHNHNQVTPESSKNEQNIDLSPPTDSVSSSLLSGLHILIVDDEPDARELLIAILGDNGAEVTAASSASEAFELLQKLQPNVLVSDIGMPEEDGYALIRKIRALHPNQGGKIPAIALTAYARSEDRTQAILAGFHLHVSKPVNPTELATMVANLFNN